MNDTLAPTPKLRIWQQNVNRSLTSHLHVLNSADPSEIDILAFQEPHLDFQHKSRASYHWHSVYPTPFKHSGPRARSLLLISRHIPTARWEILLIDSNDITAIRLVGETQDIVLFNIYNDCNPRYDHTLRTIRSSFRSLQRTSQRTTFSILIGDFNRHHPMWDEERNHHLFTTVNLNASQTLINLLADYDLSMILPPRIPTLEALNSGNFTRVDNVFASSDLIPLFDVCNTVPEWRPPLTDHLPIYSVLDFEMERVRETKKWNWKNVDWEEFREALQEELIHLGAPRNITSVAEFDRALALLNQAVTTVIERLVKELRITPFTKRWWNSELEKK